MSLRLHRTMEDHHSAQRLHALRGYAKKADRLDGRRPWFPVVCVLVVALIVGPVIARAIAAVMQ